jgi:hypothetical protein
MPSAPSGSPLRSAAQIVREVLGRVRETSSSNGASRARLAVVSGTAITSLMGRSSCAASAWRFN